VRTADEIDPAPQTFAHVEKRSLLWRFLQIICAIGVRVFFHLQVRGVENIPQTGGALIASNHQSYLDPVLIAVMSRRRFAFLAHAYLFKFKPFAWLIRALNAFPIEQGKGDVGAMKETIRLLQAGEVLNVYPEGTRSPHGKLQPVQAGVALAIRRAKVPVVPAIIVGAYEAWPKHQLIPRPARVRVMYRPAIELHHLKGDQIVAELERIFREMYAEAIAWRQEEIDRRDRWGK
jgi:1-acyl-sn-glycerol-3-phosphate acyltransferase